MYEDLFRKSVVCKACKYSENMPFYRNVYSCEKVNRLFISGDQTCMFGEIVKSPDEITPDDYIPESWEECKKLTAKRNGGNSDV